MKKNDSATSTKTSTKKKIYILDTNVLVHDPEALFQFKGAVVGIPIFVLEELDNFKREGTDRGRNTREVVRQLDALRGRGSLGQGVELDHGGMIKILFQSDELALGPLKLSSEDNKILGTALYCKKEGYEPCFISKDLNARVKADALGIETQDYETERVTPEEFYHGWVSIDVPAVELKDEEPLILRDLVKKNELVANQFVILCSNNNPHNNRTFRFLPNGRFKMVQDARLAWPLNARNIQQRMALDLLLDDNVPLVTLLGPAGTGKTFLALLAGLHKVLIEHAYEKILISRPVVPLGRDIGFLPGDVGEKLRSWMLPIYDNIDFIGHSMSSGGNATEQSTDGGWHGGQQKRRKKPHRKNGKGEQQKGERRGLPSLDEMVYNNKMSLEAITYMRGRSIPYQFILIDEVQNLTPHEVKTIISRVGQGSKIILAGDPYQIDSPYLDFSSNGLVTANERFKGQELFGSVFMDISERSPLSKLASDLL